MSRVSCPSIVLVEADEAEASLSSGEVHDGAFVHGGAVMASQDLRYSSHYHIGRF